MGAEGDRETGCRGARELLSRTHPRRTRRDRTAGQACGVGAACAGRALRDVERHGVAGGGDRPGYRGDPARAGSGRGWDPSRKRGVSRRGSLAGRRARRAARLRRGAVWGGPDRQLLRVGAARRRTGRGRPREGPGERPADRSAPRRRRRAGRLRARRPRQHVRRQSGRVRRRVGRRRHARRRAPRFGAPAGRAARGRGFGPPRRPRSARARVDARGDARSACRSGRRRLSRGRAARRGPPATTVLRLTPPLTIAGDEIDAGLSLLAEVLT